MSVVKLLFALREYSRGHHELGTSWAFIALLQVSLLDDCSPFQFQVGC